MAVRKHEKALEFLRRLRRDERGNIALMFALMVPVIFGFIALGIDVGGYYADKRKLQNAADAGAIGGAFELAWGGTSYSSKATSAASANGYNAAGDTIDIDSPPTSGSYTTDDGAVEVTVTSVAKTYLAQVLIPDLSFNISARAVARQGENDSEACVLALDTSGAGVDVSGNGTFETDNCSVASNSTADDALSVSGSGELVTDCYSVVGGVDATSGLTTDVGCDGQTGAFPIDDPYDHLEVPDDTTCDSGGVTHNDTSTLTISSGSYTDPYVICGDLWAKKGTIDLDPGLYVVKGDIKSNATGNLQGEDVTIILMDGGQIDNFNGSSTVNLSAPNDGTAGDYEGILFFQDPDTTSPCTGNNCNTLNGNGSSDFEGVLYFPDQEITVLGSNESPTPSKCLQIVALRVGFGGNSSFYSDNDACPSAGVSGISLPGDIELVE